MSKVRFFGEASEALPLEAGYAGPRSIPEVTQQARSGECAGRTAYF
jgi:hypothetical protein